MINLIHNPKFATILASLAIVALSGCTLKDANGPSGGSGSGLTVLSDDECAHIISAFEGMPEQLDFVECRKGGGQVAVAAHFKVVGTHAKAVEDHIRKEYGMSALHFPCCGWEPEEGKFGTFSSDGRLFSIDMHSEETDINQPDRWNEIPFFYVDIQELTNI